MFKTIVDTLSVATGWTGTVYGVDGNIGTPYFVVKPITGSKEGCRSFLVIAHVDPDTSLDDTANRDALSDFIEVQARVALDCKYITDRSGLTKYVVYQKGSVSSVLTSGNDDGTISQEMTFYYPENL